MITVQCYSCQKVFQIEISGDYLCPHCGISNRYVTTDKSFSPWESSFKERPFSSFISTIRNVLFSPVLFFKSMRISSRFFPVLLFAICVHVVGALAFFAHQVLFSHIGPAFFGVFLKSLKLEDAISGLMLPLVFFFVVILAPVVAFISIAFSTALYHFMLWILRGAKNGIEATLHAVCYAHGAQIALIIPFVGGIIAGIWQVVLIIIGLKELHEISYGKSILAVVLPMCICGAGFVVFIGMFIALFVPALLTK